jgi:hypothetical protein
MWELNREPFSRLAAHPLDENGSQTVELSLAPGAPRLAASGPSGPSGPSLLETVAASSCWPPACSAAGEFESNLNLDYSAAGAEVIS